MTGAPPPEPGDLATRTFSLDDQWAFAELSGDYNPMHVDPVRARRLLFGHPVAHGIHTGLWALDRWLADGEPGNIRFRSLRLEFPAALAVGAPATARLLETDGHQVRLEVLGEDGVAARVQAEWEAAAERNSGPASTSEPGPTPRRSTAPIPGDAWAREPLDRTVEELEDAAGRLDLLLEPDRLERLLPALALELDRNQIALLLASTRLVGMEAPGLHSLFTRLTLTFEGASAQDRAAAADAEPPNDPERGQDATEPSPTAPHLEYRVVTAHARTGLVRIALQATGARGEIQALVRPRPVGQLGAAAAADRVEAGEFAGIDALVVGGSRGLGEVATKLLAGGGATVTCTYARGKEDAERVVAEIRQAGGDARAVQLDVLDAGARVPPAGCLLYFASPRIRTRPDFELADFDRYCAFYVEGFLRAAIRSGASRVLYPSTVFIDDPPTGFAAYAAAKRAGEGACQALHEREPPARVRAPRLPRLRTDQTVGVVRVAAEDPADRLLAELRALFRTDPDNRPPGA